MLNMNELTECFIFNMIFILLINSNALYLVRLVKDHYSWKIDATIQTLAFSPYVFIRQFDPDLFLKLAIPFLIIMIIRLIVTYKIVKKNPFSQDS